jgi:predicted AAA+ superfamily ATPase
VREVCNWLGYSYFDKRALIDEALKLGLTEQEIVDFSEENYKAKNLLENLFMPGPRVISSTLVEFETEDGIVKRYVRHLDEIDCIGTIRKVIKAAYARGNVVIVGRGGQVVLQRKPDVLHVMLIAPMDIRVQRVAKDPGSNGLRR